MARYIELGKKWSQGHVNRMIKVPATPAGIDALEELAAAGITLNVTLIFTMRQYEAARDAIWRGASGYGDAWQVQERVQHLRLARRRVHRAARAALSPAAQGHGRHRRCQADLGREPGVLARQEAAARSGDRLCQHRHQEAEDPPWKYAAAFAGSDIETNPPATNDAIEKSGADVRSARSTSCLPAEVLDEIDRKVNVEHLEATLMAEGIKKFADPQKALLALIGQKRAALAEAH